MERRMLEVKRGVLAANDEVADGFRRQRREEGTFFVDVMASIGQRSAHVPHAVHSLKSAPMS